MSVIGRIADLLVRMGARPNDDGLYVTIAFPCNGVDYGLRFTRRLFSPALCVGEDGRLYYGLCSGARFCYVRALPSWNEADLERGIFPVSFWDALYHMARGLRRAAFDEGLADVQLACDLLREARMRHNARPRRESLLLLRMLRGFVEQECGRKRAARRARNAAIRAAYEELLHLVECVPHSVNLLREKAPGAVLGEIVPGYWRADAVVNGEGLTGWGMDPVMAASELLSRADDRRAAKIAA